MRAALPKSVAKASEAHFCAAVGHVSPVAPCPRRGAYLNLQDCPDHRIVLIDRWPSRFGRGSTYPLGWPSAPPRGTRALFSVCGASPSTITMPRISCSSSANRARTVTSTRRGLPVGAWLHSVALDDRPRLSTSAHAAVVVPCDYRPSSSRSLARTASMLSAPVAQKRTTPFASIMMNTGVATSGL